MSSDKLEQLKKVIIKRGEYIQNHQKSYEMYDEGRLDMINEILDYIKKIEEEVSNLMVDAPKIKPKVWKRVDVGEAVEALRRGKKVICEYEGARDLYELNDVVKRVVINLGKVTHGKWLIEEE